MGGTLVPNQMYDHTLVPVKGAIVPRRLDYAAAPKTAEEIVEGMCCSLDANGELIKGCPGGAVGNKPMPIFVINSQDDFDTNSDKGNISGGVMSGLVGSGAFEVETTEYVATSTYAPNDLLQGKASGKVDLMGQLPYGDITGVGVVSKGTSVNRDGVAVLSFWTEYIPAGEDGEGESSSSSSESSSDSDSESSSSSSQSA